jgi:23S rRNA (adenine2030-N6)-methyltransferase
LSRSCSIEVQGAPALATPLDSTDTEPHDHSMNYRHAFHAGNFADVLKHIVLVRVAEYLKHKDAPIRYIDSHAGRGRYALDFGAALRTGEWLQGIGQLVGPAAQPMSPEAQALVQPYLDLVTKENNGAALTVYPGSPRIAQGLLRRGDVLVANELHPDDNRALAALLDDDRQCKVMGLDAWSFLKAMLPPKERRGVILVDPPYEEPGELVRLTEGLAAAVERFATGTYLLWYPIKDPKPVARFHRGVRELGLAKAFAVDLLLRAPRDPNRLNGCGLIIVNPPYTLEAELQIILPELVRLFSDTETASAASNDELWRIEHLGPAVAKSP